MSTGCGGCCHPAENGEIHRKMLVECPLEITTFFQTRPDHPLFCMVLTLGLVWISGGKSFCTCFSCPVLVFVLRMVEHEKIKLQDIIALNILVVLPWIICAFAFNQRTRICICIAIGICICIHILAGQPQRKFQDRDLQLGLEPLSCLALIDVSSQGAQQNAMLSLYVLNLEFKN